MNRPTRNRKQRAAKASQEQELEVVEVPRIARRAIALVNQELQNTIGEAAALLKLDPKDGWQLSQDFASFVRAVPKRVQKEKY